MHYRRAWYRGEHLTHPKRGRTPKPRPPCDVDGCDREARTLGVCMLHYDRLRTFGEYGPALPMVIVVKGTTEDRFWAKVEKTDGCWIWNGSRSHNLYGTMKSGDRTVYAHRYAYELLVGPIPDGYVIDHLCKTKLCVRPEHLEAVTSSENLRRAARERVGRRLPR